jgi:hypothetical protein
MNASDGSPLNYFKRAEDYNQDGTPDVHMIYKGNMMFKHGSYVNKHINSPRVYGNPVNPSGMTQGPSMQRGVMFAGRKHSRRRRKIVGIRGPNDNTK